MWSVVEKTALAEAEVEYHDYTSDTVWVKFPVTSGPRTLRGASVVIWTTTPWTIPGNRAVSYSPKIAYGLYEVTAAPEGNWAKPGDRYRARRQPCRGRDAAGAGGELRAAYRPVPPDDFETLVAAHPLKHAGLGGYQFDVPLLPGEHVTEEAGTGFVHTAPGHGREDFELWMEHRRELEESGVDTTIPYTVDADGRFTADAPGFDGRQVITDDGREGRRQRRGDRGADEGRHAHRARAAEAPVSAFLALEEAGHLPQHAAMVHPHGPAIIGGTGDTLRARALKAIADTRFVPAAGQNRLRGMIENRPDWVVSRQRAWGVPIAVFVNRDTGEVLKDEAVNPRIVEAFRAEGADAWFEDGAKERFLGNAYDAAEWEKVDDILDVWFDSGSTHAFVLEGRPDLKWPASLYLEGSDQHRGWFHSSLLESCGTRGRAPYDAVLTHGFVMAEDGRKMSKSLGNQVTPQQVIEQSGADILRLWVVSSDYAEDLRIGPEIIKTNVDSYRKLRNTIRWMLGSLAHFRPELRVAEAEMPELERLMLSELARLDGARARSLRGVRLQAHLFRALRLHDQRPLGLLFRRPQGPALLRSGFVEGAARGADRDRQAVRLRWCAGLRR